MPVLALAGALATVPLPAAHFLGPGEISVPASVHFAAGGHTAIFATAAAIILTAIGVSINVLSDILFGLGHFGE